MKKWYDVIKGTSPTKNFSKEITGMYKYSPEFNSVDLLSFSMHANSGTGGHWYNIELSIRELPIPLPLKWEAAGAVKMHFKFILTRVEKIMYANPSAVNFEGTSIEIEEISNECLYWKQYDKDKKLVLSFYAKEIGISNYYYTNENQSNDIVIHPKRVPIQISFPYFIDPIVFTDLSIIAKNSTHIETVISIESFSLYEALKNWEVSAIVSVYSIELDGIFIKTLNLIQNNFENCSLEIKFIQSKNLYEIICKHHNEIIFMAEATNVTFYAITTYNFNLNNM